VETAEIRPLSLGELLDRAFTLYRENFWVFVGIMAIPAALGIPATFLLLEINRAVGITPGAAAPPNPAVVFALLGWYALFFVVGSVVYSMVYTVIAAAMTFAVSEAYLGRKTSIAEAYKSVRGKVWRLLGLALNVLLRLMGISILVTAVIGGVGALLIGAMTLATGSVLAGASSAIVGIVVALMFLALYALIIAAMVYLALRYAVSIQALVLENLGVLASIRRSLQLTKGRRGQVFVAMLLAFLIGVVGSMVFYMPFYIPTMVMVARNHVVPTWRSLLSSMFAAIGSSITGPIFMIVLVLCYYDTRVRKEAFDLQFMMASLDRTSAAEGTVPSA
jgi:Membrane domain of glycerophosphoryl diester phosphodiesterase